jgi:hypothetical protein
MTGLSADHHDATGAATAAVTKPGRVGCGFAPLPIVAAVREPVPAAFDPSRPAAR